MATLHDVLMVTFQRQLDEQPPGHPIFWELDERGAQCFQIVSLERSSLVAYRYYGEDVFLPDTGPDGLGDWASEWRTAPLAEALEDLAGQALAGVRQEAA